MVDTGAKLRGGLRRDEPLARHTSWRVGGPARRLQRPADAEDPAAFLRQLELGDGKAGLERIRDPLDQRARTQPTGLPSCGSVFRTPPGDHAARLIELVRGQVERRTEVRLVPEVRILGGVSA